MSPQVSKRAPVLTIAGSDCSGGAGIQADLKTITAHGCYGMSVVTALTAQNTRGVSEIAEVSAELIGKQMDQIFTDIFPRAVKIGMIGSAASAEVIVERLRRYGAGNIVLDPVLKSTSGSQLASEAAEQVIVQELFSLAAVVTPNIPEAERLTGLPIQTPWDMTEAAARLSKFCGGGILVKGGHLPEAEALAEGAPDLLYQDGVRQWFHSARIATKNTHGTGCTLSAAIACGLAAGKPLSESVRAAKAYVTGALQAGLALGNGNGPLDHCWCLAR